MPEAPKRISLASIVRETEGFKALREISTASVRTEIVTAIEPPHDLLCRFIIEPGNPIPPETNSSVSQALNTTEASLKTDMQTVFGDQVTVAGIRVSGRIGIILVEGPIDTFTDQLIKNLTNAAVPKSSKDSS